MSEKKIIGRKCAIVLGAFIVILIATMLSLHVLYYMPMVSRISLQVDTQQSQLDFRHAKISSLNSQIANLQSQIDMIKSSGNTLQSQYSTLWSSYTHLIEQYEILLFRYPPEWSQNIYNPFLIAIESWINGFTPSGNLTIPYSFLVTEDGTDAYGSNPYQTVYGGRDDVGGVDGGDWSAVIQACLDNLTAERSWKEKVVLQGDFTLDTRITLPSYSILEIVGKVKANDGLNDSLFENKNGVDVNPYANPRIHDNDIEIFGGLIDGNRANMGAGSDDYCTIHLKGVDNFSVHNITMINGWTENIRTAFCSNGYIARNIIDEPTDDGIAVNAGSRFVWVFGNTVRNAGHIVSYGAPNGIEVQDGANNIIVVGNTIEGSAHDGIQVSTHTGCNACYDITIANNTIYKSIGVGIHAYGNTDSIYQDSLVAIGNVIKTAADGIDFSRVTNSIIMNNVVSEAGRYGINLFHSPSKCLVEGNRIYNNGKAGIYVSKDISGAILVGNVCKDNGATASGEQIGIYSIGEETCIYWNKCYDSGATTQQYGIVVSGNNSIIRDNILTGNTIANILNTGTNNKISNNIDYIPENFDTANGIGFPAK